MFIFTVIFAFALLHQSDAMPPLGMDGQHFQMPPPTSNFHLFLLGKAAAHKDSFINTTTITPQPLESTSSRVTKRAARVHDGSPWKTHKPKPCNCSSNFQEGAEKQEGGTFSYLLIFAIGVVSTSVVPILKKFLTWLCIRIRLGKGRVVQEDNSNPIYHLPPSSQTGSPDRGNLGEAPGNFAQLPDILPSSGPDVADVGEEMVIELPCLSTPPPLLFHSHDYSFPPPPTAMCPISGNLTISKMRDLDGRDGKNHVNCLVTKL